MHKFLSATLVSLFLAMSLMGQNVSINNDGSAANSSAMLDVSSPIKGLLIPRMSTAAILSLNSPAKALLVYDSSKNQLMVNMGTPASPNWQTIVYNSGWNLNGNIATDPLVAFVGTADNQPLHFRINNIT